MGLKGGFIYLILEIFGKRGSFLEIFASGGSWRSFLKIFAKFSKTVLRYGVDSYFINPKVSDN